MDSYVASWAQPHDSQALITVMRPQVLKIANRLRHALKRFRRPVIGSLIRIERVFSSSIVGFAMEAETVPSLSTSVVEVRDKEILNVFEFRQDGRHRHDDVQLQIR